MKKLLNTLYILSENARLSIKGETVVVEIENEKQGQFPLHTLESIVSFSYIGATPALLGECASRGINYAFYSPYGKFLCRVDGLSRGNVLLRREQYRIADDLHRSCEIARNLILGKVYNSKCCISRTIRDHELRIDAEQCRTAVNYLNDGCAKIKNEMNLDSLRGIEGECASVYFGVFDTLIINKKSEFVFNGRNKRPPKDPVNAMLSFGYTLLANDCSYALEGVGLDSYVGFMHRDRPGRRSLALDLMEELRPVLVDRFVLTLINNRQVNVKDFIFTESGAVEMTETFRKIFLKQWQEHKKEKITHPYLKEKIEWGLVPHIQALLMARFIRKDLDGYPPFMWK